MCFDSIWGRIPCLLDNGHFDITLLACKSTVDFLQGLGFRVKRAAACRECQASCAGKGLVKSLQPLSCQQQGLVVIDGTHSYHVHAPDELPSACAAWLKKSASSGTAPANFHRAYWLCTAKRKLAGSHAETFAGASSNVSCLRHLFASPDTAKSNKDREMRGGGGGALDQ